MHIFHLISALHGVKVHTSHIHMYVCPCISVMLFPCPPAGSLAWFVVAMAWLESQFLEFCRIVHIKSESAKSFYMDSAELTHSESVVMAT